MIFYFSGTGNSKYTAKKIAELTNDTIFSIADILKSNVLEFDADERVGFVFPVYYFGIPIIVHDFLKRVKFKNIKNKYIYLVLVCEKSTGTTAKSFKNILSTNGIMISSSFSISLPDNYIPMYNVSDMSAAKKWISDSNPRLNEICTGITSRIYGDFDNLKGFFPSLTSALLYPYYKSHRKTKKFFSDSDCNSCGLCEKICPYGAIKITDNKPKWIKEQCVFCLACIHRCPKKAIQYGNHTKKRNRYYNPFA